MGAFLGLPPKTMVRTPWRFVSLKKKAQVETQSPSVIWDALY